MGVYEGLSRISLIHFYEGSEKDHFGSLNYFGGKYDVGINTFYSLEEQVKTLIHEALHLSKPFWDSLASVDTDTSLLKQEEGDIERLTDAIYSCQPRLVDYLRSVILYRSDNPFRPGVVGFESLSFKSCFVPSPRAYVDGLNSPARI